MDEMWILEWFDSENLGKGYQVEDFDSGTAPTPIKVVRCCEVKERIKHIKDVIRECSFEDDFGEQSFHYSDLNNLFKILESELNKPEVNKSSLSQNNKKEDGFPPTPKGMGIQPTIL